MGVIYKDAQGRITAANPAAEKVLGRKSDQLLGLTSMFPGWRTIHEDGSVIMGQSHPSMVALARGVEVRNFVMGVFNPRKRRHIWLKIDAVPLFRPGGKKPYGVYITFDDVTDLKLAEQALKESEERLSHALVAGDLGSWGLDVKTGKAWRSLRHDQIFGYQTLLPEWTYQMFLKHVLPDDRPEVERKYGAALSTQAEWNFECRIRRADGAIRWIWAQGRPYLNERNEVERLVGLVRDITEDKQADQVFRINEAIMRSFFDSPGILRGIVEPIEGDVVFISHNRATASFFGWGDEPIDGKPSKALGFTEEFTRLLIDSCRKSQCEDHPIRFEERFGPAGDERWVHFTISYVGSGAGGRPRCAFTGLDVTSRVHAEEGLREARDYLENLLNFANAPIICWDTDFRITRFNRAFEHMTDYAQEEVIGKNLSLLFPEETREDSFEEIGRTSGGEYWEGVEIPIRRKDGKVRLVLWNSANIYADDRITLLATIAQGLDITERKQAEENLREARDYLESLIDYANAPIICWDRDFRITRFNHAFEHMTDYKQQEVLGKHLSLLFPRDSREHSLEEIGRTSGGEYWEGVEIPIRRKDGKVRLVLWNSANIYADDSVTLLATIAQGLDITERKQAEQVLKRDKETLETLVAERSWELLQAQMEVERTKRLSDIGMLAATVAHELRNPLAGIIMASANIRRKAENPDLAKHLETIKKKVDESNQIINNLLSFARLHAPRFTSVHLCDLLDECVDLMIHRSSAKEVNVRKVYNGKRDLQIEADPVQLKELVGNVLNNAQDAVSEPSGLIEVRARVADGFITISIKDNGVGMDEATVGRAFEPFFSTKAKGTGLGLSVCSQIVEMHGGTIGIKSAPGEGTTVTISLPQTRTGALKTSE